MQYFNVNNQVHVLDDGIDPNEYIKQSYTVITKAQADALIVSHLVSIPKSPDGNSFIQSVKTSLGGVVQMNDFMTSYPAFLPAVQESNWTDVQALILDAKAKSILNQVKYDLIRSVAATHNIPIALI